MLIAIVFTAYLVLALGGFFILADRGQLPIDEEKNIGWVIFNIVVSALGLWWVVATLGWSGFTYFLLAYYLVSYAYGFVSVLVRNRIYYPVWATLAALGIQTYLVVQLWIAAVG